MASPRRAPGPSRVVRLRGLLVIALVVLAATFLTSSIAADRHGDSGAADGSGASHAARDQPRAGETAVDDAPYDDRASDGEDAPADQPTASPDVPADDPAEAPATDPPAANDVPGGAPVVADPSEE